MPRRALRNGTTGGIGRTGPTNSSDASRRTDLLKYIAQLITPTEPKPTPEYGLIKLNLVDEQGRLQFEQLQRLGTLARVTLGATKRNFNYALKVLA